jgi:hypothetical protein
MSLYSVKKFISKNTRAVWIGLHRDENLDEYKEQKEYDERPFSHRPLLPGDAFILSTG